MAWSNHEEPATKLCKTCKRELPRTEKYWRFRWAYRDGKRSAVKYAVSMCKTCERDYNRDYRRFDRRLKGLPTREPNIKPSYSKYGPGNSIRVNAVPFLEYFDPISKAYDKRRGDQPTLAAKLGIDAQIRRARKSGSIAAHLIDSACVELGRPDLAHLFTQDVLD